MARTSRSSRGRGGGGPRFLASRLMAAGVVVLAVAALYAVAGPGTSIRLTAGSAIRTAAREPVRTAVVACPAPGSGGGTGGKVAVANMPARTGAGSGQATLSVLTPRGNSTASAAAQVYANPGHLAVTAIKNAPAVSKAAGQRAQSSSVQTSPAAGGVMVQAQGAMAQGLDVEQLSYGSQPTARCASPGTDFWFVTPVTASSRYWLYLMNTSSRAAAAAVTVVTDSGPVLGNADAGIVVPPHAMVQQQLSPLLHAARVASIHVSTADGQVVAAIRESTSPAKAGSWLPAALPPSATQVLPGLPAVPGSRELYLANPGSVAAQLKITAVTSHGSYKPAGGAGVSVPAGSAFAVPLSALAGVPAAIKISANVPVTAMLTIPGTPAGTAGAFVVGAGPIAQQGVLAASPVGKASPLSPPGSSELVLSAPGHAASVEIATAGTRTSLTGQAARTVQIPARSSIVVKLKPPAGQAGAATIAVVLTPGAGSGPVYAAGVASLAGVVESVVPVASSPVFVQLPGVRSSLPVIVRNGQPYQHG